MKKCILFSFFVLTLASRLSAATVYVNGNYAGSIQNGTSWATPYKDLMDAINAAAPGDEIWMAKGTYLSPERNSLQGCQIKKDVSIFGGFLGNETSVYARDLDVNKTIVSPGGYRIFTLNGDVHFAIDGLNITGFNAVAAITEHYDTLTNNPDIAFGQRFYVKINNCKFYNGQNPIKLGYTVDLDISNSSFDGTNMSQMYFDQALIAAPTDDSKYSIFNFTNVKVYNYHTPFIVGYGSILEVVSCEFSSNTSASDLFILQSPSKAVTFKNCVLRNSSCRLAGGYPAPILYEGCTFKDNTVVTPLILSPDGKTPVTIRDCKFLNNDAGTAPMCYLGDGGSTKNVFIVENTVFSNNKGNLINSTADVLKFSHTDFLNNTFSINSNMAAFMRLAPPVSGQGELEFDAVRMEGNTGDANTIILLAYTNKSLTVKNSSFKNNSSGVAFRFIADLIKMEGSEFVNIQSLANGTTAAPVECHNNSVLVPGGYIKDCVFMNNSNFQRGALQLTAWVAMSNCTFKNNKAKDFGGAFAYLGNNDLYISDCLFESNTSETGGGAIATWTVVRINRSQFKYNKVLTGNNVGGGALMTVYGMLYVYNSLFEGNTSVKPGGAISLNRNFFSSPAHSEFRSCTFVKNSYSESGTADGEVFAGNPRVLTNSILWGNGTRGPISAWDNGSTTTYNDVQGGMPGEGNLDLDPKFIDFDGGNYHLSCASPLMNKGSNEMNGEAEDLDKAVRVFAGTVDIGAYEFPQDPTTATLPPTPNFTVNASACRAEQLQFGNTTTPSDGVRYEWNFGDGVISQLANPAHAYAAAGNYTVTLRATNACGASAVVSHSITINDAYAPTISYVTTFCPGQTGTFTTDATCSSLVWSVEGGTIQGPNGTNTVSVLWGDGSTGNGKLTLLATGCGTGLCETPVSIIIPIVPVNFQLQGPDKLCKGATGTYETVVKNITPSTIYTWTVKNGTVNGNPGGYNLNKVDVRWSTTDTSGVIYLTTNNELLHCGRTDSVVVKLRPLFKLSGAEKVCESQSVNYSPAVGLVTDYNWSITGSGNSISTNGEAAWGTTSGNYQVIAEVINPNQTCNAKDTLKVELFQRPIVSSITGETEVTLNSNKLYTAVSTPSIGVQYQWVPIGGSLNSSYGNTTNVYWGAGPYGLTVVAKLSNGVCASLPYNLDITADFVYTISGPDTVCIGTTDVFTANSDPLHPTVYNWSSNFSTAFPMGDTYQVTFDKEGTQSINLKAERNGKEYNLYRNVYVKAAPTDIAISGPQDIDPSGTGTYVYKVRNSQNLNYNHTVVGASNVVKNGNDLTVTWGGNPPFKITVIGIVPGNTCTGVPAVIQVNKAPALSTQITSQGTHCLNSRVKYTYLTDNLATDMTWSVSTGGTIISNTVNEIIVEWSSTGNKVVTFSYERFGLKTFTLNVDIKPLPVPVIRDVKVCGSNPTVMSTTVTYNAYKWFLEPNTVSFSAAVLPNVTSEGQYRVEVTDANGCVAFGSKYIEQIPLPKVKIMSEQEFGYCIEANKTVSLDLKTYEGQDYHYQWYMNNVPIGTDNPVLNRTFSTAQASVLTYTVKVTLQTCSQMSQEVPVTVYSCNGNGNGNGNGNNNNCNADPVAFTVSSTNGCPPFTFNNASANVQPTDVFGWTFGDGTSSSLATPPQKTYNEVGIYYVYLSRSCQLAQKKVMVPGLALYKVDAPGCKGQSLTFNELSVNIPGYPIVGLAWDFGDGNTTGRLSAAGPRDVSHVFVNSGAYTVRLTVYVQVAPGVECSNTFSKEIVVTAPPIADFTVSPPPCTDNTYKFIDHSTYLYSAAKYLWDFGNGNTSTLFDPSQKLAAGTQNISLEVTDLLGCKGSVTKSQVVLVPNEVGAIVITGDTTLCNGRTVTLTSPLGSSYVWKKDGVVMPNTTQSITVSTPGSYVVDYAVPGCVVTTLAVVLKNFTVPNLLSGNKKVCEGEALFIESNLDAVKYSFGWKFNTTDLTANTAQLVINNAQLSNTGNYTLTVTDNKNGCILALPPYDITVYSKPAKPVVTPSQQTACYDGSLTLQSGVAPTGFSFVWYSDNQPIANATGPDVTINTITSGHNYKLKLTEDNSGCFMESDNQYIGVAPKITVSIAGDLLVCENTAASFGTTLATLDYKFEWYKDGVLVGPTNNRYSLTSPTLADAGDYYVVATSTGNAMLAGCKATSNTLTFVVKAGPVKPVITGPTAFCTGSPITLSSNLSSDFVWNTGAQTSSINVTIGGTYTVTSTHPVSGCSVSASQAVQQNPLPDLSFFPTGVYSRCASDRVSFQGLEAYSSYAWYVNGALFNTTNKMYPTKTGKYTLKVTSDKNCVAYSDTLRFTSLKCPCYVKNTDNDGPFSLREAIECSNTKYGRDYIDFEIPGTGPFVIKPETALPVLTDSVAIEGFTQAGLGNYAIVIDGSVFDKNGLVIGANLTNTDISGLTFQNFKRALSLETGVSSTTIDSNVFVGNKESGIELNAGATNNTISNNNFSTSATAIALADAATNNTIQRNSITTSEVGIGVYKGSSYNTISFNEISGHSQYGVWLNSKASNNLIQQNNITGSTLDGIYINNSKSNTIDSNFIGVLPNGVVSANLQNGIRLDGTSDFNTVRRNQIGKNGAHGVLVSSGSKNKLSNNYIGMTSTGSAIANQKSGIASTTDTLYVVSNKISNNLEYGVVLQNNSRLLLNTVENNTLGGVFVTGKENRISKTVLRNTNAAVKAIDLHASVLPAGNQNKQPAVFTKYRRSATGGLILKGTAVAGDTVEVFVNNNTAQQAIHYINVAAAVANASGVFELEIPAGIYFDPNQKNYYVNTASDILGNTSELSQPFMVGCFNCVCTVSNTDDSGAGSLRAEVDNANTGGCLTINFSVATPAEINILSPISDIVVPLTMNGTIGGVDPLIFVKGNGSFNAFNIFSDGVNINHLGFTHVKEALTVEGDYSTFSKLNIVETIRPVRIKGNNNTLTGSAINTFTSTTSTYQTDTLVVVTGNLNQIGQSGAGNRLVNATQVGIAVSVGINNSILYNEIFDNTIAIKHQLNGNNLYPVPFSMVGSTLAGVSSVTGKAQANDRVQLFMSAYYPEQAYTFAAEVTADGSGNWTAIVPASLIVPNQNNYVVATATHPSGSTSPLSYPVRIGNFVQVCYVKNTLNAGKESLRDAVDCANLAGISGVPARIEFQLPSTPNEILVTSGFTVTNNFGVKINPFATPVTIKAQAPSYAGFTWATNNLEIKNLTFDNFATALHCEGSYSIIDSNEFLNDGLAIAVNAPNVGVLQTITNNYFANCGGGILSQQGSVAIGSNTFGASKNGVVGSLSEFGISVTNANSIDVSNNTIKQVAAGSNPLTPLAYKGVPLYIKASRGTVRFNTIQGVGASNPQVIHLDQFTSSEVSHNQLANAQTGILIENSLSTELSLNTIKAVTGKGIDAIKSDYLLFMQNTVEGLQTGGKPIELHLNTTDHSNDNKPAPEFISATFHDGKLFLIGQSEPTDYIELFYSDINGRDLVQYTANTRTDSAGVFIFQMSINAADAKNYYFRATARNSSNRRTSEASAVFNPDLKICLVTTASDNVTGSLREAITKANANTCNLIQFDIAPGGLASLEPVSDLPLITASQLIIDATSQQGYSKGTPTIQLLDNAAQNYAFSATGVNQFNVYGIKINGYDTSIAVTNSKIVELNDNVLNGFAKAGVKIKSNVFLYGNVKYNNIASSGEYGITLTGINNIFVDTNTVSGISNTGIYAEGVNQKIMGNVIIAGNNTSAVGIALQNASDVYVFKNTILNAYRGLVLVQGSNQRINSNTIGSLLPADLANGYKVEEDGIFVDQTSKIRVYRNDVSGTQKAVFVQHSFKPTVQNTKSRKVRGRVIHIADCDSAIVNFNSMDSIATGIYVSNSKKTYIQGNNMSNIKDYGVYLDTDADSSLLVNNVIGAEFIDSKNYSQGVGLYIKSSHNVVGGSYDPIDSLVENTFFHNKQGGIVVDQGIGNAITYNNFFENDISLGRPTAYAIALKNGGNADKAKPTITDHKYIGGLLHLYGTGSVANDSVHVYIGKGGYEEARGFMGVALATGPTWEVVIDTVGKVKPKTTLYLVATATDPNRNTSPLSKLYILGDCYVTSLRDTTDNEYPMPNSLRMAVNCANGQKAHVGIYYKVDKYGEKDVELQMKLQPIYNPYGVSFNAKNLITDRLLGGIDGTKLPIADDTAWVIAETLGASQFDSLHVDHCKNGILVLSDSISIKGFSFENNKGIALSAGDQAEGLYVMGSSFKGPQTVTSAVKGIVLASGIKYVRLESNAFGQLKTAVLANTNDSLSIVNNKFGAVGPDTLVLDTAVSITNSKYALIDKNNFVSSKAAFKALSWTQTQGVISENRFACDKATSPLDLVDSKGWAVVNNTFTDSSVVYLSALNTEYGIISGNSFGKSKTTAVAINNSSRVQIKKNSVTAVKSAAFDVTGSEQVFISRNTVTNVYYKKGTPIDSGLCINIHKNMGIGVEANYSKPEPINLTYALKKGDDHRTGIFVQGTAEPGDSVEIFFSDSLSASMDKYIATGFTDDNGLWEVRIPRKEYYHDTITWYHVVAVAIKADSNTSQTSSVLHIPPVISIFYVRNDYDSGPNSLRDALDQVNASDLLTRVVFQIDFPQFQPGPYHIKLDSGLAPIYSYMGYIKDGNSQLGKGAGDDQRIIVEAAKVDTSYVFDIVDSSDVCKLSNIWFNDARLGVRLSNNKNEIKNFHFMTSGTLARRDTALVITGNENEIKTVEINDYKAGLVLTETAGENKMSKFYIDRVGTGIIASDSAYKNNVKQSFIYRSSEVAILTDSAAADNVFTNISIGKDGMPITGCAIKVNNSPGQTFTNNRISVMTPYTDGRLSSAVVVTGNSRNSYFFGNKIGVDSLSKIVYPVDMRGFTIIPSAAGKPQNTTVIGNEISGMKWVAIYADSSTGDLIAENLIGIDSLKNIHRVDSTAIYFKNCDNMEASDNVICGYKVYGINLVKSDNVRMNRNVIHSTFTNNKAINLNINTLDVSNGGLVVPVITQGVLVDTQTVRLSGTSKPNIAVEVYESVKDTMHSVAYVNKVITQSNATGTWTIDVPRKNFSFAKANFFVAQNHEAARSSEFSASYVVDSLLCQLAESSPIIQILDPEYKPCPGPVFELDPGLNDGLHFSWTSDVWNTPKTTRKITMTESAPNVVLVVTDDFGCSLTRHTDVNFKERPINPDFIVASEVYAGDTVVLVDVSLPVPKEYTWLSSAGVQVLSEGSTDVLVGEDGYTYPKGTRFIEFILPDSGEYNITQKSLREGCKVELSKDLKAKNKNPNDEKPYALVPEVQSLSAYPNPSNGSGVIATLKAGTKDPVTLKLTSVEGSFVWTAELSGKTSYKVLLPDMVTKGVYLLKLETAKKNIVFKLVVN